MQPGRRSEVQGRRRKGLLASLRSDLRGQSCRCFRGQISNLGSQALVRPMWASLRNLATRVTLQDLEGEGRTSLGDALGYTATLKCTHLGGGGGGALCSSLSIWLERCKRGTPARPPNLASLTSSRVSAAARHRGIFSTKAAAPAGERRSSVATARNSATLSCSGMASAGRGRRSCRSWV